jgi:hypothetical protein
VKHYHINLDELRELWNAGWLVDDLAARYKCTKSFIYWLRKRYDIGDRSRSQSTEPGPPSPEDGAASTDSLALSPWVAARAEPYRIEKELRGERATSGVAIKTYSLRTLKHVDD